MIIVQGEGRFTECLYAREEAFENDVVSSHRRFFGPDTILIDAKKKIGSKSLGNTIPDGFLFDMSDPTNREFYLVEVELVKHDFYQHIFPQITKFFGFFRDSHRQKALIEWLFSTINADAELKEAFKKYLGKQEIFKFLTDAIDTSQNILLVIDGSKPELPEITDTYSDTWGKMVKVITIKKFQSGEDVLFTVDPEFEAIEYSPPDAPDDGGEITVKYSEEFHLEGVSENVKVLYARLKERVQGIAEGVVFNPQKYYISIRGSKNLAYVEVRKKKIRLVILLPEETIRERIQKHRIRSLSESVQGFYNNPCAAVDIDDVRDLDEIVGTIQVLVEQFPPKHSDGENGEDRRSK